MTETSPHQRLDQMISGYWISQAIYAAAKFGIADHLKNGPKPIGQLAEATSTNPDALYRLLRALASEDALTVRAFLEFRYVDGESFSAHDTIHLNQLAVLYALAGVHVVSKQQDQGASRFVLDNNDGRRLGAFGSSGS